MKQYSTLQREFKAHNKLAACFLERPELEEGEIADSEYLKQISENMDMELSFGASESCDHIATFVLAAGERSMPLLRTGLVAQMRDLYQE